MEYKIGDRVEARVDTDGEWFPATVRGFGVSSHDIFIQFDSGGFDWWPDGDVKECIRPLPTTTPPFKVWDEVEVRGSTSEFFSRATVDEVKQAFDKTWIIRCGTRHFSHHPDHIRPYTPPKLVPLSAEELLGKWVKDAVGDIYWVGSKQGELLYPQNGVCFVPSGIMSSWQWSDSPAVPWKPCSKEEVRDEAK